MNKSGKPTSAAVMNSETSPINPQSLQILQIFHNIRIFKYMVANFLLNCQSSKAPYYPCLTKANPTPRYLEFLGNFSGLPLICCALFNGFGCFYYGIRIGPPSSFWSKIINLIAYPSGYMNIEQCPNFHFWGIVGCSVKACKGSDQIIL